MWSWSEDHLTLKVSLLTSCTGTILPKMLTHETFCNTAAAGGRRQATGRLLGVLPASRSLTGISKALLVLRSRRSSAFTHVERIHEGLLLSSTRVSRKPDGLFAGPWRHTHISREMTAVELAFCAGRASLCAWLKFIDLSTRRARNDYQH